MADTTKLTPRPYQSKAKAEAYRALKTNRSALVVMPTGTGKGALIGMVLADAAKAGRRVLAMVHRKEIVDQLAEHARRWAGIEPAIERAEQREATDESLVVVASVPSIWRRLDRFAPDRFDLVIADEAHHCLARSWIETLEHFAGAKILGFTATPNRGDELALGQVFDVVAFDMTSTDAILGGWLVPFRTEQIKLESLDLSAVRKRHGELVAGELGEAMSSLEVLREAVEPVIDLAADKQAIIFTCTIEHMKAVAMMSEQVAAERRLDLSVATVDGTTPTKVREQIFEDFRARRINWLVNVEVATEGFDAPTVEVVVMLRPTLSQALYTQMLGRGGRPLPGLVDGLTAADMAVRVDQLMARGDIGDPDGWLVRAVLGTQRGDDAAARRLAIALSPKLECLVIDFTDNSEKHAVVSALDLLGGDYELPDVRLAQRLLQERQASHLIDALERAKTARLAQQRGHLARLGDPFALFDLHPRADRYRRSMTPKQRRWLEPLQLPRGNVDVLQANILLAELARREKLDLCRYSQAALLARLGCPVERIAGMTRAQASAIVRELAAGHWWRPSDWPGILERSGRSTSA